MNKQILQKQLVQLGLSKEEADIYLFLIENGPSTFLEVSRGSDIERGKIYRSIDELTKKSLVELSKSSWGRKLVPSDPKILELLIKQQEMDLQKKKETFAELVDELSFSGKKISDKFIITTYRRKEGLQQMLWNELKSQEKIVYVFATGTINTFTSKKFGDLHRQEAASKRISYKELNNDMKQANTKAYNTAPLWDTVHEFRHLPRELLDITHNITIYDNVISIINWTDSEYVGIEIKNKLLAKMFKQLFEVFWGMGTISE